MNFTEIEFANQRILEFISDSPASARVAGASRSLKEWRTQNELPLIMAIRAQAVEDLPRRLGAVYAPGVRRLKVKHEKACSVECMERLSQMIPAELQRLTLVFCMAGLGPAHCAPLTRCFYPGLTSLNLQLMANRVGPEGVKKICCGLPLTLRELHLDLYRNKLTSSAAQCLHFPHAIRKLELNLMLNDLDENAFARFSLPPGLQTLTIYLQGNALKATGTREMVEALPSTLREVNLYLQGNMMGDTGVVALMEGIPSLPDLTRLELHLQANLISNDGALKIVEALAKRQIPHVVLHLEGNRIDDEGARELRKVQGDVFLYGGRLGQEEEGMAHYAEALLPFMTTVMDRMLGA